MCVALEIGVSLFAACCPDANRGRDHNGFDHVLRKVGDTLIGGIPFLKIDACGIFRSRIAFTRAKMRTRMAPF